MAVAITAQSNGTSSSLSTSISFSAQAIGTAAADRLVDIGLAFDSDFSASMDTLTIGGISATKLAFVVSGSIELSVWSALVPTGTTATFVFGSQGSDATQRLAWEAYSVIGADTASPLSGSANNSGTGPNLSAALALPTNGGIIGVGVGGGTTTSWTNLTRDLDAAAFNTKKASVASTITQGGTVTFGVGGGAGQFSALMLLAALQVPQIKFLSEDDGVANRSARRNWAIRRVPH